MTLFSLQKEEKRLRELAAKKEAAEKARKEAAEKAEAKERARREVAARKEAQERKRKEEARQQAEERKRREDEAAERQRQVEAEEARRQADEQRREAESKAKLAELKRKQAEAKAAAATMPKLRPMAPPVSRKRQEEKKPKVVLTKAKERKCYMWYARLGQPNKERMLQAIKKLPPSHEPITAEDVEALPWIMGGSLLPVKEMNELFMNADKDE